MNLFAMVPASEPIPAPGSLLRVMPGGLSMIHILLVNVMVVPETDPILVFLGSLALVSAAALIVPRLALALSRLVSAQHP